MKKPVLQNIQEIAKQDFISVESQLKSKRNVTASVNNIHLSTMNGVVTASCEFQEKGSNEAIVACISYRSDPDGIYADSEIDEVSDAILAAMDEPSVITAAEGDEEDVFEFDDDLPEDMSEESTEEVVEEEAETLEGDGEYEDPEDQPNIDVDNNISGHYIAECDRCHGVFISALVESDQHVEFLSGICPLCEKESDQYIKWVIKPVE